jgi:hypothetical protein
MALNPFFLHGSIGEKNLIQDLVNEQLRMYGVEIYYIPRSYINEKTIIEEVSKSEFKYAVPLEAYVETYEGYSGAGTLLSKFGVQELDDLTLTISKERYELAVKPLIHDKESMKLTDRPKEGDLIYFPLGDRLFEIKYVEHEKPFYQLQGSYTYELRCELFAYNNELVDTNIDFIDDNVESEGYNLFYQMVGFGSTASAITSTINGGVTRVNLLNRGSGYTNVPSVGFSSAPNNGLTAVGIASMISGIIDFCEPNPDLSRVQAVNIVNPGYGYTVAPQVSFIGGGGSGARATSVIGNGVVGIITIMNGGSGYLNPPTVTFTGISTIQASAKAVINSSGTVTQILITNGGLGYQSTPTITISSPESIVGYGTYIFNEIVVGSSSSITARVKSWNGITKILELSKITGSFNSGENLVGQESGATYRIKSLNTDNSNDGFAQNQVIQDEANQIIDFSESNPFGTP